MSLCLLLLPAVLSWPGLLPQPSALAAEADVTSLESAEAAGGGEQKIEKARDVYYKTEGIVSGDPAPQATDSSKDYVESAQPASDSRQHGVRRQRRRPMRPTDFWRRRRARTAPITIEWGTWRC